MSEKNMKPKDVDIDGILKEIGIFGKYQIKTFLWLILPIMMTSFHANNYILSAANVNYRCKIPGCDNETDVGFDQSWLGNAIPKNDKCNMYRMVNTSFDDGSTCPEELFDTSTKLSCDEYVYKEPNTLVEELGIACQEWKRTLIGTMHSLGTLLALPMIGFFSDRYGRRAALVISIIIEGTMGIIKGLSVNYAMFLAFELLEPTIGSGGYSSTYILALEALVPSTRVLGGCTVNVIYGTSQVIMGLLAYSIPYWRTFLYVIYAPSVMIIFYFWILLESTRWLLTKKRYSEVIENIKHIAKTNGKDLPKTLMAGLYYNAENVVKFNNDAESPNKSEVGESQYKQFFKSKIMIFRVIKCSFWWITCTFSFYGLSINSVFLKGNRYQNFIYSALMEVPSHVVEYFGLVYLGRKWTLFIAFTVGGLSCLSFAFIPEGADTIGLISYMLGKFFVTISLSSVYLYTSEIFPTSLRHSLLATCSMIGRVGSILAPQTPLLTVYMDELPSILFGSTCLISALLMLTSPETLNLRLPENIDEAERITELKIK